MSTKKPSASDKALAEIINNDAVAEVEVAPDQDQKKKKKTDGAVVITPAPRQDVYKMLDNRKTASEYKRKIGENFYNVREDNADTTPLHLEDVDCRTYKGNPRMWHVHRAMLSEKPDCGPMTEQQQIDFLRLGYVPGFTKLEATPDKVAVAAFETLREGLEASGEASTPLFVRSNGAVLDGCRRTSHTKLTKATDAEKAAKWGKARMIVLPPNVLESDVRILLGLTHGGYAVAEWESINKAMNFIAQRDVDKKSLPDIATRNGMTLKALKVYLEAGDRFLQYQRETQDHRPQNFTVFYKVASNPKLGKILFPDAQGVTDATYDEGLWPRFRGWVKDKKIKHCCDVTKLNSKKENLLGDPMALQIIDTEGTTKAIQHVRNQEQKRVKQPGIKKMQEALSELMKIKPTQRETLAKDDAYRSKLRSLLNDLIQQVKLVDQDLVPAAPSEDAILKNAEDAADAA